MGATLADAGMALMKLMAENHALEEENAALKIEIQRLKGNVTVLDPVQPSSAEGRLDLGEA